MSLIQICRDPCFGIWPPFLPNSAAKNRMVGPKIPHVRLIFSLVFVNYPMLEAARTINSLHGVLVGGNCLWYYRRNEQCELILVSEASLQQDRFILLSSSNVSQFLTPWLFLNSSLKFISPENNSTVAQSRTLREIIFFTRLRIALHRKEWQCNLLYSVFVCCFFSLQSTLYDYRQLPFFAYCVPVLCTST